MKTAEMHETAETEIREAETTVSWRSFPLADDWPRSIVAPLAVVGFTAVTLAAGMGLLLAGLSFVVLFVALIKYFVPVYYELSDRGVKTRFLGFEKSRKWTFYRKFYAHNVGVYLSTLEKPGPLDGFRGTFLRFAGNRDEVTTYIGSKLEEQS